MLGAATSYGKYHDGGEASTPISPTTTTTPTGEAIWSSALGAGGSHDYNCFRSTPAMITGKSYC